MLSHLLMEFYDNPTDFIEPSHSMTRMKLLSSKGHNGR